MSGELVLLLGRRDVPTDALEDYSRLLGEALARRGPSTQVRRVPWVEEGWTEALAWLREVSAEWRGSWVIVQYTALSWSRRGFPARFPQVLRILQQQGCHTAVVFHDAGAYPGRRPIDRVRRIWQHHIMRTAYRLSDASVIPIPPERVTWLPTESSKAVFIPVGANVPASNDEGGGRVWSSDKQKRVVVFSLSGGTVMLDEVADIAYVMRRTVKYLPRLELVVLGRGSEGAKEALCVALRGARVPVHVLGLLEPDEIARQLRDADAMLFVRGHISSRRGSALAGIACGLPVIAYAGNDTASPVTEAGVLLVREGDREGLSRSLTQVLSDAALWRSLHDRSLHIQRSVLSWDAIANRFVEEFTRFDTVYSESLSGRPRTSF